MLRERRDEAAIALLPDEKPTSAYVTSDESTLDSLAWVIRHHPRYRLVTDSYLVMLRVETVDVTRLAGGKDLRPVGRRQADPRSGRALDLTRRRRFKQGLSALTGRAGTPAASP
jgi:hypothetical protein